MFRKKSVDYSVVDTISKCPHPGHDGKALLAVCTAKQCEESRLMCSKCLTTLHKNHREQNIKIDEILDEKKITKHWPPNGFPKELAEFLYHEHEVGEKSDLERQIDNFFKEIEDWIRLKILELKLAMKADLLDITISVGAKLENLKKRYEESYDLGKIKNELEMYLQGHLGITDLSVTLKDFFSIDRDKENEVLQYLLNSIRKMEDIPKDTTQTKVPKLTIDIQGYSEFIEEITAKISEEQIKKFVHIEYHTEKRKTVDDHESYSDLLCKDLVHLRPEFLKPISKISTDHTDQITNFLIMNVPNEKYSGKQYQQPYFHFLVTTSEDASIKLWDLTSQTLIYAIDDAHNDWILSLNILKLTKDETQLIGNNLDYIIATGSSDGMLRFWNWRKGENIGEIKDAHSGWVSQIEVLPISELSSKKSQLKITKGLSKLLVTSSWDREIKLWDWVTMKCIKQISTEIKTYTFIILNNENYIPQSENALSLQSIPEENSNCPHFIANAGWGSGAIKIWNWITGVLVSELKAGKCSRYDALTSLPDKKDDNSADSKTTQLLAAAGFGETHCIEIWDYMKGSLLKTIKNAHSEWIKSIKIIPAKRMDKDRKSFFITGWYIVSGSTDNTLKFWDWKAQDPHVKSLDKLYPVSKLGQLVSWVIETRDGPQPIIITVMDEGNSAVFIAEEYIQM